MEIVITFEACAALLKKSVENGHFALSLQWNFQKVESYQLLESSKTTAWNIAKIHAHFWKLLPSVHKVKLTSKVFCPKIGILTLKSYWRKIYSFVWFLRSHYYTSHVMRKPVYAKCKQQRRRSACASTQSDQRLVVRCLEGIIPLTSIYEISSLYLVSAAEQADLSLPWSQTPKT